MAVVRQGNVERIGDLADVGKRHLEAAPIRPREVQHTPRNAVTPPLGLRQQPADRPLGLATRHNVEQLAPGHVHDRGAPPAGPPDALAPKQGLIEAEGLHGADPVAVGGQQRLAPREHRPVRRVSVTTQLRSHIRDRSRVAADLQGRPTPRPGRQRRPRRRDLLGDFGERPDPAVRRRATPPPLVPDEAHRTAERRQIHQPHRARALGSHRPAAAPTDRPALGPNMQLQRPSRRILHAEDLHVAKADDQLTDMSA